jgi:hypothetical protein
MALLNGHRRRQPRPEGDISRSRVAALSLAILSLGGAALAASESLEMAVKATYLYKLAPFVSWPSLANAPPTAPLVICVQGADPFGPMLDRAILGQTMGAHPVVVRRVARLEPAAGCHIAYVAGGAAQSQAQALQAVDGSPVLTVTDEGARAAGKGGIVRLLLDGGKVRFSIDAGQADRNGVAISSKLLALAVEVKR